MTFIYDEEEYTIPNSLADITLAQHISWNELYGRQLAERRIMAQTEPDETMRELQLNMIFVDEATRAVSHYTGIPLSEVENNIEVGQIMNAYTASQLLLAQEERGITVEEEYDWDSDVWVIFPPNIGIDTPITREEFRAIKRLAEIIVRVSDGSWADVKVLCAAYLRHPGEEFDTSLIEDESPRITQMADLPMNITLAVLTYLKDTLAIFNEMLFQHLKDEVPDFANEIPEPPEEPHPAPPPAE